jgi:hypothetical protein
MKHGLIITANLTLFPTANVAARSTHQHRGRGGHRRFFCSNNNFRSWGRSQNSQFAAFGSKNSSGLLSPPKNNPTMGSRPTCQVCGKMGHTALTCYHRFDQAYQSAGSNLTAYAASSSYSPDINWYPDTGATHHITSDLNNLNLHSESYDGLIKSKWAMVPTSP